MCYVSAYNILCVGAVIIYRVIVLAYQFLSSLCFLHQALPYSYRTFWDDIKYMDMLGLPAPLWALKPISVISLQY